MYICLLSNFFLNNIEIIMKNLSKKLKTKLKKISTATIATCLYKKGYRNQYIQNVFPLNHLNESMVGEAFTLRYIPAREDLNPITVFQDPMHPQRVAIETCPKGAVLVIDSRNNARAASAGSILVTRLMKRGATGIVTDGGFRDSSEIAALPFPSFHQKPSAPTNLTLHQALDINVPIGCGDVAVFPGDIIVGDNDGVMVIPSHIAEEVAHECLEMTLFENYVIEKVNQGHSIIGLYPLTNKEIKKDFIEWLKSNKNNIL
jgi:regulator of RNase E activity RraA